MRSTVHLKKQILDLKARLDKVRLSQQQRIADITALKMAEIDKIQGVSPPQSPEASETDVSTISVCNKKLTNLSNLSSNPLASLCMRVLINHAHSTSCRASILAPTNPD